MAQTVLSRWSVAGQLSRHPLGSIESSMDEIHKRYRRALIRNLYEIHRSLSYRNAYNKLWESSPSTSWGFFSYASLALFDGIFSHAIKVLDKHKDAASFFYILNCNPSIVKVDLEIVQLNIGDIQALATKLNKVRDKTHFHIDKRAVFHPDLVWKEANITGNYFNTVMDKLWLALNSIYIKEFNKDFGQPIYKGTDVVSIIDAVQANNIVL